MYLLPLRSNGFTPMDDTLVPVSSRLDEVEVLPRKRGRKPDYQLRLRAFEMFAAGMKKGQIANELGKPRQTIYSWAETDRWDDRLYKAVTSAEQAVDLALGNAIADGLAELRRKVRMRVAELDALCGPTSDPSVRLRAIQAWLKLAGIDRAMPNPAAPSTPLGLELVDDLVKD